MTDDDGRGAARGTTVRRRLLATDAGSWVLLPQAVSRLSALYVFAVAANRLTVEELGVLAIATAAAGTSVGIAPAIVAKPLAAISEAAERRRRAPWAGSFAVVTAVVVGLLVAAGAAAAGGYLRLTLAACAIAAPGAMAVESSYWRTVFKYGRRRAGLLQSSVYLAQAVVTTAAALLLPAEAVILAPFAALAIAGAVSVTALGGVDLRGAWRWVTAYRATWLPFLYGVAAAAVLAQLIPIVLAVAVGLPAASAYRAAELVFGATNLLIGVLVQGYLTRDTSDRRRAYKRSISLVVAVATANGVAVALLPDWVLSAVLGPVVPLLREILVPMTLQKAFMGIAFVGSILLVGVVSAVRLGALGVVSAGLGLVLLTAGALAAGLPGGVAGLMIAEAFVAAYMVILMRRVT